MGSAPMRSSHNNEGVEGTERPSADALHWYQSDEGQARLAQATEHFRLGRIAPANADGAIDRVDDAGLGA